jgi:hypothetical protein
MVLSARSLTGWTLLNIVAAAAFVWLASWTWLEPNLRGEDVARGGDALIWMFSAAPVLGFSLLANAIWLVFVSRERRRNGGPWPGATVTVIAATWISVLFVDHFRGLGF